MVGTLAQLVEHRTENPGVPSSILGGTTKDGVHMHSIFFLRAFPDKGIINQTRKRRVRFDDRVLLDSLVREGMLLPRDHNNILSNYHRFRPLDGKGL